MTIWINIVRLLHTFIVVFTIITPFIPNIPWTYLLLHVTAVASLLLHWILSNDACFLTLVECYLRGVPDSESFIHSIVSPIYKIDDKDLQELVIKLTPLLGLISLVRLINMRKVVRADILDAILAIQNNIDANVEKKLEKNDI